MIPQYFLANLAPWLIQGMLVALAGALLPLLFRIRHPRSQIRYYHAVLILCFVLPFIQPWQESLAIVTGDSLIRPVEAAGLSSIELVAWLLAAGVAAKLAWLAVGLYQLRGYRKSSIPLCPIPESIREARRLTGTDAMFRISHQVGGPATVGHIDPVVLLPESFRSLDAESQRSIVCHELLHVQRRDWLVTMIEEVAGSLLWFNPGIWWLLAQTRLAREQLVDSEVVKNTARDPYIEALLSMAVVSTRRWALPAAWFFTEGHLVRRMRLLMSGPDRSALQLCVRYGSLISILALLVVGVFIWFPLSGETRIVLAAPTSVHQVVVHAEVPPLRRLSFEPGEFNLSVPPPADSGATDVLYFVHRNDQGTMRIEEQAEQVPGSQSLGFVGARGIRMLRPGVIVSNEEIQRLKEALGDRVEVSIDQAEDGTVRRIQVLARRLSNEADNVGSIVPFVPAEPISSADGVR